VVAKVLERIVAIVRVHSHQCAYHQQKSTEQKVMVAIAQAIDCKLFVCVAFLDLHKVFDSLDHYMLL